MLRKPVNVSRDHTLPQDIAYHRIRGAVATLCAMYNLRLTPKPTTFGIVGRGIKGTIRLHPGNVTLTATVTPLLATRVRDTATAALRGALAA